MRHASTLRELIKLLELADETEGERRDSKRAHSRLKLLVPVSICALKHGRPGPSMPYQVRDVSEGGMGIKSHFRFWRGEHVIVDLRVMDVIWRSELRVKHCTQTIDGYNIGLEHLGASPK